LAVAGSDPNPELDGAVPTLIAFRGVSTENEPSTQVDPLYQRSAGALVRFESSIPPQHEAWLRHRYAVAMRRDLSGGLRAPDGTCLDANSDGSLELVACNVAAPIALNLDGTLHIGTRCLQMLPTGELVAGDNCMAVANHRFFLDDEGHLWAGAVPFA